MSDPAVAAQRQQVRQQGLIAGLVTLPFRFFGVLCGSLFLCIMIECVGMHFFWPEEGWHHAQTMLNHELALVSESFTRSVLVQEPGRSARQLVGIGLRMAIREEWIDGLDTGCRHAVPCWRSGPGP
jgi:integrating conjugative element membrane protein (TIGR03747 family)